MKYIRNFLFITLVFILITPNIYSASTTIQFVNDTSWTYTQHSWEITVGEGWVIPHTAFERINGLEITFTNNKSSMTITKGTKKIIVDLITRDYMIFGARQIYIGVYELKTDVYWLPAEIVCDYLGITFEMYQYGETPKETIIRISDNTAEKTIEQLINSYNPELNYVFQPVNPPDDNVTEPIPQEPVIGDRLIFFTFEGDLNEYTVQILEMLHEYDIRAAFFITGNSILNNVNILRKITVSGHTFGLHTMTHDESKYKSDIESLIAEFEEENELLYKLTKKKTRLCRAPEGSSTNQFFIDNEAGQMIYDKGYIVWDWNVNMIGMTYDNAVSGIKRNEIPVFRFDMDESAVEILPLLLDYIAEHEQFTVKQITESTEEVNFIGRFN